MERRANTVVGSGLKLDSMPDAGVLGIEMEQAEAWAKDVESRWNMWAKDKTSTRSELFSFNQ